MVKLTGAAGSPRSIMNGLDELINKNVAIWGAVSDNITGLVEKKGFTVFKGVLYYPIVKGLVATAGSYMFGMSDVKVNLDASLTIPYDDVGTVTKYLVSNDLYLKKLVNMNNVPTSVKAILQKIIP